MVILFMLQATELKIVLQGIVFLNDERTVERNTDISGVSFVSFHPEKNHIVP